METSQIVDAELVPTGTANLPAVAAEAPESVRIAMEFLATYRGRTREAYERDLAQWFQWCVGLGVDPLRVRRAHVTAWISSMDHQAPSTVARKVSVIRNYFEYAVDEEVIERNPMPKDGKKLHLRRVSSKSQTLGPDRMQARRLLEAARQHSSRDGAIVSVLLHQGLRVSELCGLDVSDIGNERGHQTIQITRKGGERQVMALAPNAAAAVSRYREEFAPEGPLFSDGGGERMTRHQVAYLIAAAAKDAEIDKRLSPHSLRHTCATQLLDEGVPIRDVQVFLGHASPTTTQRYDLGRDQLDRSPAYALSGVFG